MKRIGKNRLPAHLRRFILGNSKRIVNNFVREMDGLKTNTVLDTDTDSFYKEENNRKLQENMVWLGVIFGKVKTVITMVIFLWVVFCS